MVRKSVWAIGIAAAIAIIVVLLLPVIASTQIVRDSIAQQVGAWSGYRVRLEDAPEIRVWPSFTAILNDAVLSDWRGIDDPSILQAERVEISLSALAALRGEVVFTKIKLVRPSITLEASARHSAHGAPPRWGKFAQAIEATKAHLAENPTQPDISALPDQPFGMIEIVDGELIRPDSNGPKFLEKVNGTLDWPALNRPATFSGTGVWHDESVSLKASAQHPLLLLAGGRSALTLSIESTPLALSFEGEADIYDNPFVMGALQASASSLERFVEWSMLKDLPQGIAKAGTLKSQISGDTSRIKFENVEIGLDSNRARGVLDIAFAEPRPTITGTLAFQTLDIRALLTNLAPPPTPSGGTFEVTAQNSANLDLRMSARNAALGSVTMSDVAATAQIKDGLLSLDISDAIAFGGNVQLGVRLDSAEDGNNAELRITADNIDGGEMAAKMALLRLMPKARGSFSIFIKGHGEDFEDILETADGSVSASFGKGTIPGLNLKSFRAQNDLGRFFPLSQIADGSLAIERADMKATLAGGIAWIDKAEAVLGAEKITLGGLVPFAGRGIALSGSIVPVDQTLKPEGPTETFFIGGSWSAPFIAPFLVE